MLWKNKYYIIRIVKQSVKQLVRYKIIVKVFIVYFSHILRTSYFIETY